MGPAELDVTVFSPSFAPGVLDQVVVGVNSHSYHRVVDCISWRYCGAGKYSRRIVEPATVGIDSYTQGTGLLEDFIYTAAVVFGVESLETLDLVWSS